MLSNRFCEADKNHSNTENMRTYLKNHTQALSQKISSFSGALPSSLLSLSNIINNNLCHRCGTCIGICPTSVLSTDKEDYPIISNITSCTNCNLCVKVCSGASFHAIPTVQDLYKHIPDLLDMYGHFESAYLAYAVDRNIRQESSSGGLITSLLIYLLENKIIDGALVVTSDNKTPWKGQPILARSVFEILEASRSKYAIVPTNVILSQIRRTPGKYAIVGLPCQIHGIRKAMKLHRRIQDRVYLTIGLFCHATTEHEPMSTIWSCLGKDIQHVQKFTSRLGKHPGTPYLQFKDGTRRPLYFSWTERFGKLLNKKLYTPSSTEMLNVLYRLYTPIRCFSCYDSTAEFADIAVGDPWMTAPNGINFTDGYSFVLARNTKAIHILKDAEAAQQICLYPLQAEDARKVNSIMGKEKRQRAFWMIRSLQKRSMLAPDYGFDSEYDQARNKFPFLSRTHMERLHLYLNLLTHILCFFNTSIASRLKKIILRISLSPIGYCLLWLNFQKRRLRNYIRDKKHKGTKENR